MGAQPSSSLGGLHGNRGVPIPSPQDEAPSVPRPFFWGMGDKSFTKGTGTALGSPFLPLSANKPGKTPLGGEIRQLPAPLLWDLWPHPSALSLPAHLGASLSPPGAFPLFCRPGSCGIHSEISSSNR